MEILKYCKMQLCLLLVLFFVGFLYIKDGNRLAQKSKSPPYNPFFDRLFVLGQFALFLDGFTTYTVNHLTQIPEIINMFAHLAYLLTYQMFAFTHLMYWLSVTDSMPKKLWQKMVCYAPIVVSMLLTVIFIPDLNYRTGVYTNYSMGISAYACFAAIGLYSVITLSAFLMRRSYILQNKRTAFILSLSAASSITLIQLLFNETLISGIAVILIILSIYFCMENPSVKFLEFYHDEMVMGFATLVESKDGSTGGHIRRSSAYAVTIAKELRRNPEYAKLITKDYVQDLQKAAPMHDIGKIGIPDDILQKPGGLTEEEFAIMKQHPEIGGKIIQDTFGHLDDDEYKDMSCNVATSHHEKWGGGGYPAGISGADIPLCARIMAVADVFDALSSDRCYRSAMPLEECFQIIRNGRGKDFDPAVVDAFFSCEEKIKNIYRVKS